MISLSVCTCTHVRIGTVHMFFPFFISNGHLCFSQIFFVILLAGRVSVCASMHVRMCSPLIFAGCCLRFIYSRPTHPQSCHNIRRSVMPPKPLTRRGGACRVAISTTHPANVAAATLKRPPGGGGNAIAVSTRESPPRASKIAAIAQIGVKKQVIKLAYL